MTLLEMISYKQVLVVITKGKVDFAKTYPMEA